MECLYCLELDQCCVELDISYSEKEGVCKGLALNLYMHAFNLSITFNMIRTRSMNSVVEGLAVVCQVK